MDGRPRRQTRQPALRAGQNRCPGSRTAGELPARLPPQWRGFAPCSAHKAGTGRDSAVCAAQGWENSSDPWRHPLLRQAGDRIRSFRPRPQLLANPGREQGGRNVLWQACPRREPGRCRAARQILWPGCSRRKGWVCGPAHRLRQRGSALRAERLRAGRPHAGEPQAWRRLRPALRGPRVGRLAKKDRAGPKRESPHCAA